MKQLQATNTRHMSHLKASDLKPEDYLTKFAEYCVELAIQSGWGSRENLGTGLTVHISDTRGRKTSANANLGHAVGICWHSITSEGNHRRIEIDRETSDTMKALEIVAHEVSHAVTPEDTGHKGAFVELVFKVFKLGGIPTATAPTRRSEHLLCVDDVKVVQVSFAVFPEQKNPLKGIVKPFDLQALDYHHSHQHQQQSNHVLHLGTLGT